MRSENSENSETEAFPGDGSVSDRVRQLLPFANASQAGVTGAQITTGVMLESLHRLLYCTQLGVGATGDGTRESLSPEDEEHH